MRINDAGLDIIKRFEGMRFVAYQDSKGIWTIGYGHTKGVQKGDVVTQAEADAFLKDDLSEVEFAIEDDVITDLNPNQFSALVCLVFNIGTEAFKNSNLLVHLNRSDFDDAADQFQRWNHIDGTQSPGLTRRRQAEEELFRRPIKALVQSRTIQAGTVAGAGSIATVVQQLSDTKDTLSQFSTYKWAAIAIGVITIISVGIMLYARWDDHRKSVR